MTNDIKKTAEKPHLSPAIFVVLTFYLSSLWHGYSIERCKKFNAKSITDWHVKYEDGWSSKRGRREEIG